MNVRKISVLLMAVLMSLVCAFAVGCKPKDPVGPNQPVDKPPVVLEEGPESGIYYHEPYGGGSDYLISLNSGNKFSFFVNDENKSGEYTLEGEVLTLDFNYDRDKDIVATYKDDTITLNYDNAQLKFLRKVQYKVNYDPMGGSAVAQQTVINGKTAERPEDPVRDGYVFLGWYTDEGFTTPFLFGTTRIMSDTKIYARWVQKEIGQDEFLINFDVGYDGGENPIAKQTINGHIYTPDIPERPDYVFKGWWYSMYGDKDKLSYEVTEDVKFAENTTLYALWESETGFNAPIVSVTEEGISLDKRDNVNYSISVTGPDGFTIPDQSINAVVDIKDLIDFSDAPNGDYQITVRATMGSNSATVTRYFKNKALAKVSLFNIVEPSTLIFNPVANAENYLITIQCGDPNHNHNEFNIGKSTHYNFANCPMVKGGIKFTVTAIADGFERSVSDTFVYNRTLEKIGGLAWDADTEVLRWNSVPYATNYMVKVLSLNMGEVLIDNGNATSICLKDYSGNIVVEVYPATKGYNSPEAVSYTYKKVRLATPTDVKVNGMEISWSAVRGAVAYELTIGDRVFTTTDSTPTYTLTEDDVRDWSEGNYKLRIMAKADTAMENSLYSDEFDIGYLTMSDTVTYYHNTVSWKHVLGVTEYEVQVNDQLPFVVSGGVNYAKVTLDRAGDNIISVRIKTDDDSGQWISTTVYAYTVSFNTRGGVGVDDVYVAIGDEVTLPQSRRQGYVLEDWYNSPKGPLSNGAKFDDGSIFTDNVDIELFAYWVEGDFIITYEAEGGEIQSESSPVTFGSHYTLEVPTKEGDNSVAFAGWYAAPNGLGRQYTDQYGKSLDVWDMEDAVLYAYWAEILTFELEGEDPYLTYRVTSGPGIKLVSHVVVPDKVYNEELDRDITVSVVASTAFKSKTTLVSIELPNTMTDIPTTAFDGCDNLESIVVYDALPETERYYSYDGVLIDNSPITSVTELILCPVAKTGKYEIPWGVQSIALKAFYRAKITEVVIPLSVTTIQKNAFYYLSELTTVNFISGTLGEDDMTAPEPKPNEVRPKIPELTITADAFYQCSALAEITIPSRAAEFPLTLFSTCRNLQNIRVEDGNEVYSDKDGLLCTKVGDTLLFCPKGREGEVVIPNGIQTIESSAFKDCEKITSVVIPGFVAEVRSDAFYSCGLLSSVKFTEGGAGITSTVIGDRAFSGCSLLGTIEFEEKSSVSSIGNSAFSTAYEIKTLNLPSTIRSIGTYAFNSCKALTSVVFEELSAPDLENEENSLEIKNYAFRGCELLTYIKLPAHLDTFSAQVFSGCYSLVTVEINENNKTYSSIDGVVFSKDKSELILFPYGNTGDQDNSFTIPENTKKISSYAFSGAQNIKKVIINKEVTLIDSYAFQNTIALKDVVFLDGGNEDLTLNQYAFASSAVQNINLPARLKKVGDYAFSESNITEATIRNGVEYGKYIFNECVSIKNATIEDGATIVPYGAFYSTNIETIYIPKSVIRIDARAFQFSELKTITFEKGGTEDLEIGREIDSKSGDLIDGTTGRTFGSSKLTAIEIPARTTVLGQRLFQMCYSLKSVTFETGGTKELRAVGTTDSTFSGTFSSMFLHVNAGGLFENTAIESIIIPARFTELGSGTFFKCMDLQTVEFEPNTKLTELRNGAFYGCTSLRSIEIPDEIKKIGTFAFTYCRNLQTVDLPDGITAISKRMFMYCDKLSTVNIPNTVTSIDQYAFGYNYNLRTITIPGSVKTIDTYVFSGCRNLSTIIFESGEETLDVKANVFYNCASIESIDFGDRLNSIDKDTFSYCTNISDLKVSANATKYSSSNGILYDKKQTELIYCPPGKAGKVTIPNTVKLIKSNAFYKCNKITEVDFQTGGTEDLTIEAGSSSKAAFSYCSSLETINLPDRLVSIPGYTFYYCASLSGVLNIPDKVKSIGTYAFYYCGRLEGVHFGEQTQCTSIDARAFYACYSLAEINLPKAITKLNDYTFYNTALTSIELHEGITEMGTYVFQYSKLESVTIPASVTKLGNYVFSNCTSLYSITFAPDSKLTTIGTYCFEGTIIDEMVLPTGVTSLGNYSFRNSTIRKLTLSEKLSAITAFQNQYDADNLTQFVVPDANTNFSAGDDGVLKNKAGTAIKVFPRGKQGSYTIPTDVVSIESKAFIYAKINTVAIHKDVTSIATYAFQYCNNLTTVNIDPDCMATVGNYAFDACPNLKNITMTKGTSQGTYLFRNSSITTIDIPEGVTSIPNSAFQNCKNLVSVSIPSTVTTIGSSAFAGCENLAEINLPTNLKTINASAFQGTAITKITIPSQVTSIPNNAFQNCLSLTEVKLSSGITSIGTYAFQNTKIKSINLYGALTTINNYAFDGCTELETVTFADDSKLTTINQYAFQNTNISEIILPSTVKTIGIRAFANNKNLKTIQLSNDLTTINDYAFENCESLEDIAIPANVATIGANPFKGCTAITAYSFSTDNAKFSIDENGILYDVAQTKLISYPAGKEEQCELPETLTSIAKAAFANSKMTEFTWPETVHTIDEYTFTDSALTSFKVDGHITRIGANAFENCTDLVSVTFEDGPDFLNIAAYAFSNTGLTSIKIPARVRAYTETASGGHSYNTYPGIGNYCFYGCDKLSDVTFAESTDDEASYNSKYLTLGQYAFSGTPITSISFPTHLAWVYLSSSGSYGGYDIKPIGNYCFADCELLSEVIFPETTNTISFGTYAFANCKALHEFEVKDNMMLSTVNGSTASMTSSTSTGLFSGSGLRSITLPETCKYVYDRMFENCTELTEVTITSNFEGSSYSFGQYAFAGCTSLRTVNMPDALGVTFPAGVFSGCTLLESIEIPSGVTTINAEAFKDCASLRSITFPIGITTFRANAFEGCTSLNIEVPTSIYTIEADCFSGWGRNQTITIKGKVTNPPAGWDVNWRNNCNATIKYDSLN